MANAAQPDAILSEVEAATTLGQLRRIAKKLGTDHDLALELWALGGVPARRLAILIMDKKQMTQALVDQLDADVQEHDVDDRLDLFDWLLANQLMKAKSGKTLLESWEDSDSPLQRRLFWYYQARLRWTGQSPPSNTDALLDALDAKLSTEEPEVQWAMNFTAGQIGTFQPEHRARCVALGKRTGLYRDEVVAPGCTPSYLPEFIRIQVGKL